MVVMVRMVRMGRWRGCCGFRVPLPAMVHVIVHANIYVYMYIYIYILNITIIVLDKIAITPNNVWNLYCT